MFSILAINISDEKNLTEFSEKIKNNVITYGFQCEIAHYSDLKTIDLNLYNSFVFSPTSLGKGSVWNTNEWSNKLNFTEEIFKTNKPILGLCGGHLLIGMRYNAKVIIDKEKEIGNNKYINIVEKSDSIFNGIDNNFIKVKQMHNNSIELPKDFHLLATSEKCRVQLMRSKKYNIYSAQFHMEENLDLFNNYLKNLL
jgi:GMP synthase (glutamine-hydrolysing)